MKHFVFSTKGGVGKSLAAREIVAGPAAKEYVMIEIDELNKTQSAYKSSFKQIIELNQDNIKDLLVICNEHDDLIIDVGVDNLSATMQVFVDYALFDEIDQVIIPLFNGRTDSENALKSYAMIQPFCANIKFIFGRATYEPVDSQFSIFFNNIRKIMPDFSTKDYVIIYESDIYIDAQNQKRLVAEIAEDDHEYKVEALDAKHAGNMSLFNQLMQKELLKRAAKLVMKKNIVSAHDFLVSQRSSTNDI